jgi:hypothetical protein
VLGQLLGALAGSGIDIHYVPAVETDDGVTAAGLTIGMVFPVPPELASGLKEARAQVTLGLASASVSNRAVGDLSAPASIEPVSSPVDGGAALDVPSFGPTAPPPAGTASGPIRADRVSAGRGLPVDISLTALYPVLVLAAAIGVGLINLIRHLGVRSP